MIGEKIQKAEKQAYGDCYQVSTKGTGTKFGYREQEWNRGFSMYKKCKDTSRTLLFSSNIGIDGRTARQKGSFNTTPLGRPIKIGISRHLLMKHAGNLKNYLLENMHMKTSNIESEVPSSDDQSVPDDSPSYCSPLSPLKVIEW